MSRETVLLAKPMDERVHALGWWASEKLDGMRFIWDGGVTIGQRVVDVPFANTLKIQRFNGWQDLRSTGLWSRYLNPIYAPKAWIDKWLLNPQHYGSLTGRVVEGELDHHDGWQAMASACKKLEGVESEWEHVRPTLFDAPNALSIWSAGEVRVSNNQKFNIKPEAMHLAFDLDKAMLEASKDIYSVRWGSLPEAIRIQQHRLGQEEPLEVLRRLAAPILDAGGEGMIVRNPCSRYLTKRDASVRKFKPRYDSEAIVINHGMGKVGGRHEGRLGFLTVRWCPHPEIRFDIGTGFTDTQRDNWLDIFPVGTVIEFEYRQLTNAGIPKEASFKRIRKPNE